MTTPVNNTGTTDSTDYIGRIRAANADLEQFNAEVTEEETKSKKSSNAFKAVQGTIRDMPA